MDFITVDCVTGVKYYGMELKQQRELPNTAKLYECGTEIVNGEIKRGFSVYKRILKSGSKFYIVFSKYSY